MVKVKLKSNMDGVIRELDDFLKQHNGVMIRASVWTEVHYAVYVEYGTWAQNELNPAASSERQGMAPRAMIRKSMPAIEAFFESEWKKLPFPFSESQLRGLWNRTIEFAHAEITRRTPRSSLNKPHLQDSWQIAKARIYKNRAGKGQSE